MAFFDYLKLLSDPVLQSLLQQQSTPTTPLEKSYTVPTPMGLNQDIIRAQIAENPALEQNYLVNQYVAGGQPEAIAQQHAEQTLLDRTEAARRQQYADLQLRAFEENAKQRDIETGSKIAELVGAGLNPQLAAKVARGEPLGDADTKELQKFYKEEQIRKEREQFAASVMAAGGKRKVLTDVAGNPVIIDGNIQYETEDPVATYLQAMQDFDKRIAPQMRGEIPLEQPQMGEASPTPTPKTGVLGELEKITAERTQEKEKEKVSENSVNNSIVALQRWIGDNLRSMPQDQIRAGLERAKTAAKQDPQLTDAQRQKLLTVIDDMINSIPESQYAKRLREGRFEGVPLQKM